MTEALEIFATSSLWAAVLRIATPLIFGALGALICERSGVLNLGIEGIMTMGALVGWIAVFMGADLWTGVAMAAASGLALGFLHALLTVPLGLSQHVSGLGITLFASSLAYYLYRLTITVGDLPPTIEPFQPLAIPGLSDLPFVGPVLFAQTGPTYLALAAVALMAWILARTPLGLAIRMSGENPHAVEAQGLNPIALRMGAVMVLQDESAPFQPNAPETLGAIAAKFQCDVPTLARANGLKAPAYSLRHGQTLKLQGCDK